MATEISTLSITDLHFPNVTICPSRGSHTALNYDLMKASRDPLTKEEEEKLSLLAYTIFVEAPFHKHFDEVLAVVNPDNIENLLNGFQTIPSVAEMNVTETSFCSLNGTYHTPWFQGDFQGSFFLSDQQHRIILEFPENLKELIGSGHLVIELEVEISINETVWIRNDTANTVTHQFHSEEKQWEDAERYCDSKGGHLATFQSPDQQRAIEDLVPYNTFVWVGAIGNNTAEHVWDYKGNHSCYAFWKSRAENYHATYDHTCSAKHAFVCQAGRTYLFGNTRKMLRYAKNEITFSSFNAQYSYSITDSAYLTLRNEKKMTGLKISWEIHNKYPAIMVRSHVVGQIIKTPLQDPAQSDFYENDQIFEATLEVPQNLSDQIGTGSLIIKLEVNLREEKGLDEEIEISRGGPKVFTVHQQTKSWHEAEAFCRGKGGNLASIESEEELQKAHPSYSYGKWIGGIKEDTDDTWRWSDGTTWMFSPWESGVGNGSSGCVCAWGAFLDDDNPNNDNDYFKKDDCTYKRPFVCQTTSQKLKTNSTLTFSFNRYQISFTLFKVRYNNYAAQYNVSNLERKGQSSGFQLSWSIQDQEGNPMTKESQDEMKEWRKMAPAPKYDNNLYARMVELARQARIQGIPTEVLVERALNNEKITWESRYCYEGQLRETASEHFFGDLEISVKSMESSASLKNEDLYMGAKILFAMKFCPPQMSLRLLIFFKEMFKSQSSVSIIRTIVDTIQSGILEDEDSRSKLNELYLVVEEEFDLQYGKVLLALSSKEQIEELLGKDWPFFVKYSKEVDHCLRGISCDNLIDIIATLGKKTHHSEQSIILMTKLFALLDDIIMTLCVLRIGSM